MPPAGGAGAGAIGTPCRRSTAPASCPAPEAAALIDRVLALASALEMPAAGAGGPRPGHRGVPTTSGREMIGNVLADAIPFEAIAEHALVAAAMQVQFARAGGRARAARA